MARVPPEAVARNGAWLVLPPLAISLGLWGVLPSAFASESFDRGIPTWLSLWENALRVLVFATPSALLFGASSKRQRAGWALYAVGLCLYLASYMLLAAWPQGVWGSSLPGFTAPAWTPAVWLLGVALVCQDSWLWGRWRWCLYLIPATLFIVLHVGHAAFVWSRI